MNILKLLSEDGVITDLGTPHILDKDPDVEKKVLRLSITAEFDAISLYEKFAKMVEKKNKKLAEVFLVIAQEERIHVGEFETMLLKIDKQQEQALKKGEKEVDNIVDKK